jgi:hypothetical protein
MGKTQQRDRERCYNDTAETRTLAAGRGAKKHPEACKFQGGSELTSLPEGSAQSADWMYPFTAAFTGDRSNGKEKS